MHIATHTHHLHVTPRTATGHADNWTERMSQHAGDMSTGESLALLSVWLLLSMTCCGAALTLCDVL